MGFELAVKSHIGRNCTSQVDSSMKLYILCSIQYPFPLLSPSLFTIPIPMFGIGKNVLQKSYSSSEDVLLEHCHQPPIKIYWGHMEFEKLIPKWLASQFSVWSRNSKLFSKQYVYSYQTIYRSHLAHICLLKGRGTTFFQRATFSWR